MRTTDAKQFKKLSLLKPFLILAVMLLPASQSFALEVGDLKLYSKLGRPLSAQIQLSNNQQLNAQQLIVKQAPLSTYKKMGIDASALPRDLIINVDNSGLVSIKTRNPINEPYLHFILVFQWPNGEINREYKLLIDP
jgi:pilus assembly protein FimV